MTIFYSAFLWLIIFPSCKNNDSTHDKIISWHSHSESDFNTTHNSADSILTGADQIETLLPLLKNKYVACVVNQTSIVANKYLVDTLIARGVKVSLIFAPEHGFRGEADAGASLNNSRDSKTGIPIISLYGKKFKPSKEDLQDIDIVIYDIQDVGVRFYTYISTLHYLVEACAENRKELIVLDNPDPNGFYVDGPVLKKEFSSFIGIDPIPVVYGMTSGEYALMVNGEKWTNADTLCNLKIIPCKNYLHTSYYAIKIPPSPNIKTMQAVYLYPSLCFFEGTNVSVGRGTNSPFEMYGSPYIEKQNFQFTPTSTMGAKSPLFENKTCYGFDLSAVAVDSIKNKGINLDYLLSMYNYFPDKSQFFSNSNFFNKLAGNDVLLNQIKAGLSAEEIKLSWQDDIVKFKAVRKKYLLYPDFE